MLEEIFKEQLTGPKLLFPTLQFMEYDSSGYHL